MQTELKQFLLVTVAAFMIGCGYTQLRTETGDHRSHQQVTRVQERSDFTFTDRMVTLARRAVQGGRDSLSIAQSDSIDKAIIYLTRKKDESGLESFTEAEREFLSLVVTRVRHRQDPPNLYEEQTDSTAKGDQ